ncbi:MAG TPA: efflux RND transporter periplasmic adaptor subunit [Solimonas sp.]|nr:efflux RND transporter periplasmic adaptor subunit [Solimonas sp.]
MNTQPPSVHLSQPQAAVARPSARKRMIIVVGACVVVFGGVFGWKAFMGKMMGQYFDHMPVPPATITTAAAQQMTWDSTLEAIGSLVPVNGANLTTESGGIVTAIHFESGASVEKGEPIVTLDKAREEGELRRLEAQAQLAEINRSRRAKLLKLDAVSKSDYDAAVSAANAAKAAVEAQRGTLGQKEIRAPFAGQLGIRRVNIGQYVAPGTPIVSLQSMAPVFVDFALAEQQIGGVQPGQQVKVTAEAYPGVSFSGEVLAVEPRVDEATRNFNVRATLPNHELKLHPGQFVRVTLSLAGEHKVLVVPRTAISYSSYGTAVFVVQPKKPDPAGAEAKKEAPKPGEPPAATLEVAQRFVKTGEVRGDFVAITDGLEEGEQIATSGLLKLHNQQPVIVDNKNVPDAQLHRATPTES